MLSCHAPPAASSAAVLLQLLSKERPALVLCDFMAEACADACETLGIPYALTLSSLLLDCKCTAWVGTQFVAEWAYLTVYRLHTTCL